MPDGGLVGAELAAVLERLFHEPNIRFEDGRAVWRSVQAFRHAGPESGPGFADALIVFKALRAASDAGEALDGVYAFDRAMRRLPHTASP